MVLMRVLRRAGAGVVACMVLLAIVTVAAPSTQEQQIAEQNVDVVAGDPFWPKGAHENLGLADVSNGEFWLERTHQLNERMVTSPSEALRSLAEVSGIVVDAGTLGPADVETGLGLFDLYGLDLQGLDVGLVAAVAQLYTAIEMAEVLRTQATAALSAEEERLVLSLAQGTLDAPIDEEQIQVITAKVDQGLLVQATLLILDTIDRVTPQLQAAMDALEGVPRGGGDCSGGPDIIDAPPHLAIDGAGASVFTDDYRLTIDLGGNDCYENQAGTGIGDVSVAIDLGGDDTYRASSTSGGVVAQGVGMLGIGILVDFDGDDHYEATSIRSAPQPGPAAGPASVVAQGAGALGVGVLVDSFGTDRFIAHSESSGGEAVTIAQGAADLAGVGLLFSSDVLAGATEYSAHAVSTLHQIEQTPSQQTFTKGPGEVYAQGGSSSIGAAALVDTAGDDHYDAQAHGLPARSASQGGSLGGVGVLVDALGDDVFTAQAIGEVELSLIVQDTNFCWAVTVTVSTADTVLATQGGADFGAGILAASGIGTNQYVADVGSLATAHAEVRLSASSNCPNQATASATSGNARLLAQGAVLTGVGVQLGGVDLDQRNSNAETEATARALVNHGIRDTEVATANAGTGNLRSHGTGQQGAGIVFDPAGDDSYTSSVASQETERTNSGQQIRIGDTDAKREGWASTGVGWLIDLDGDDTYSTSPAGNDHCWTQPDSVVEDPQQARGRDFTPDTLPLLLAGGVCP